MCAINIFGIKKMVIIANKKQQVSPSHCLCLSLPPQLHLAGFPPYIFPFPLTGYFMKVRGWIPPSKATVQHLWARYQYCQGYSPSSQMHMYLSLNAREQQKQISTVAASSDGALLELHDVLRQSSRLVGEDVLDLTELLVQGGGSSLHREESWLNGMFGSGRFKERRKWAWAIIFISGPSYQLLLKL